MNKLSFGGSDTLTPFQVLRRVKDATGLVIRMAREDHLHEELVRVHSTDTVIKLVFTVKRYRSTRRGRVLIAEGLRATMAVKVQDRWSVVTDLVQVADVEDSVEEIHRGLVETPDETLERVAYEEMCFRPGSARTPMDTASRVVQKNELGI